MDQNNIIQVINSIIILIGVPATIVGLVFIGRKLQIKVYLYNTPKRRMSDVAPTLGIYVRDQYLSAHPEIVE
jgi:hypothetical protein